MQLQGSYFIQRDVFGRAHFLKVHNTFEQNADNTMLIDATLSQKVRPDLDHHMLKYGLNNIVEKLFHSADMPNITYWTDYEPKYGNTPVRYNIIHVQGKALLTEYEAQYVLQQDKKLAQSFAKLETLRERVEARKTEHEALHQQNVALQQEIDTDIMMLRKLEEILNKQRDVPPED